jgi:hypothetical protein
MKEKMRRMEKDIDELRKDCERDQEKFVTHQHLNAVVEPMRQSLETVQKDVKEILRVVSRPPHR